MTIIENPLLAPQTSPRLRVGLLHLAIGRAKPAVYRVLAMTPLDKTLKRVINIKGEDFVVTLSPDTLKLTRKGHQRGMEIRWDSLVSGEAALAVALQASVGKFDARKPQSRIPSQRAERNAIKSKLKAPPATAKNRLKSTNRPGRTLTKSR